MIHPEKAARWKREAAAQLQAAMAAGERSTFFLVAVLRDVGPIRVHEPPSVGAGYRAQKDEATGDVLLSYASPEDVAAEAAKRAPPPRVILPGPGNVPD